MQYSVLETDSHSPFLLVLSSRWQFITLILCVKVPHHSFPCLLARSVRGYLTVSGRSWVSWKARSPTLFSWLPSSKLSAERFLQREKAYLPICMTLFGMTMLLIPL